MDELKPTGFETADAIDRFRAVRRGQPFNILWPSDVDEAIEALEDKLNRRPAPENKPLTLDQLRRMDGQPVWWWNKSHAPVCTICIARFNEVSFVDFDYSHDDSTGIVKYERWVKWGFKPYARKPEE